MSGDFAITSKGIMKSYDGKEVLKNCTMTVEKGQIYGLLGPNGAGKTTTFKVLTGLITPSAGEAQIMGFDVVRDKIKIQRIIGSIIETPLFYDHLSAKDNIKIHLEYMDTYNRDIEELLKLVGLPNTGEKPISQFSLGMKQRLGIARALSHKPKILILDEPINGLDPIGIIEIRELFISLVKKYGVTILISSHILPEIEQIADVIGVIVEGRIVQEVSMDKIRESYPNGLEEYFTSIIKGGKKYV